MRILIVEDEPTLGPQLKATLEGNGYAVDLATDGEDGHFLGSTEDYDAAILDLGLPEVDGLTVLDRWRREKRNFPVLVLTARDSWSDKVAGLDAGADDYLAKPFQTEELIARLRALIRRASGNASSELIAGKVGFRPRFEHDRGVRHPHPQEAGCRHHHDDPRPRISARRSAGLIMAEADAASPIAPGTETRTEPAALASLTTGSLARRMIAIAALWISVLLIGGGFALDRVLTGAITRNFDSSLEYVLIAMIRSSEIGPDGEVRLIEPLGDQRFLEPYSGLYWQISGGGQEPYRSRSLWERTLKSPKPHVDTGLHTYDSTQFPDEQLRILERNVILPGSKTNWRFQIAQSRQALDEQIRAVRATLIPSLGLLGVGLIVLAALQTFYGLWPLRHIRRAIAAMRGGRN